LIYLRYGIQSAIPGFLNYNSSLEVDKQLLMKSIVSNSVTNKKLKRNITSVLVNRAKLIA